MMWVSGPSSSGKTTTTVKLTERLKKQGLRFLMLNLDDYFWSLVEHPTDWINDRNYETPEALDIQLLNQHLRALLDGETIEKPVYSFKEGRRTGTKPVKLEPDQILLLDCLHGFYPPITEGIDASAQFRLYIETQNVLYEGRRRARKRLDAVSPTCGSSGACCATCSIAITARCGTILHWHYVRYGELFSIIPLMGLADHVVNGGFPFDLPALKPFFIGDGRLLPHAGGIRAVRRLSRRPHPLRPGQGAARIGGRLHRATARQPATSFPATRVIREFIGGSTIKIPHNE